MSRVLVPLDGSSLAEAALPVAERIAAADEGVIILLAVGELVGTPAQQVEEQRALGEIVERAASQLEEGNVLLRTRATNDIVGGILDAAVAERADQIVMTTHGRSGFSRLLHGSVSEAVLRMARIPVTLVRPGGGDPVAQRKLLHAEDGRVAVAAAAALEEMGEHVERAELIDLREAARAAPEGHRLAASEIYLRLMHREEAIDEAVELLRRGDSAEREAAMEVLPEFGRAALAPLGELALRDDELDAEVRWAVYHVISEIGGLASIPWLVRALQSEDQSVRWIGSNGLAPVGAAALLPVIRALASGPATGTFHHAARRVLKRLKAPGYEDAFAHLMRSLSHETSVVQSPVLALRLADALEAAQV